MILAIGIYAGYLIFLLALIVIWNTWRTDSLRREGLPISVIIPFRNEEENLRKLVDSLSNQADGAFEVVFVNDHSEDNGLELLSELLSSATFQYQVHSLEKAFGKKEAITAGIQLATHDLIITTDADCYAEPHWLREMSGQFQDDNLQMLVGPVALTGDSFWQKMQSIEFSSLIGTGGVFLRMKMPLMANGANLAYRKEVFNKVNGFNGIDSTPSGDDELLMHKVKKEFPNGIRFQKSRGSAVQTSASFNWSTFKQQRLRWASKWKVAFRLSTILSALVVFVVQLIQLWLIFRLIEPVDNLKLITSLLLFKLLTEFIFLWSVRRSFGQKMNGIAFLVNYLLYPFYVIYFGIAANFGKFKWKGRAY
ncbi:glycosyltransferase [Roseivirga sp. E12]|uniref:glycosyltransferase n=1 Tax=Roseivirga sp. E12 TaxID=2819237 RepID=UPI001ABD1531|nr:glycosyltransferase [Roseivirga sp. E12]MBO3698517.1 glycosyltransferase [Roseivirga sp. E12]